MPGPSGVLPDQAAGNVKDKLGNLKQTARDAVEKVKDKLHKN
jgi:uncharacterized protein YjbJ (UPF0337 family)